MLKHCETCSCKEDDSKLPFYDSKKESDKCTCGHIYYRHFDSWDNMKFVGCKYCGCTNFEKSVDNNGQVV